MRLNQIYSSLIPPAPPTYSNIQHEEPCTFCTRHPVPYQTTALSVHITALGADRRYWCSHDNIDTRHRPISRGQKRTIRQTKHWDGHTYRSKHMHTVDGCRSSSLEVSRLRPAVLMQPDPPPDVGSMCHSIDPVLSKPFNPCNHWGIVTGDMFTHNIVQLQYEHREGMRASQLSKWLSFVNKMKDHTLLAWWLCFTKGTAVCNVNPPLNATKQCLIG